MSSDADGRLVKMRMIVHLEGESSMWWVQNFKQPVTDSWQSERWDVQLVWCRWVKSATAGKVCDRAGLLLWRGRLVWDRECSLGVAVDNILTVIQMLWCTVSIVWNRDAYGVWFIWDDILWNCREVMCPPAAVYCGARCTVYTRV